MCKHVNPVQIVWNDNQAEIIYISSTREVKRGSTSVSNPFPFHYLCLECCAYVYVREVGGGGGGGMRLQL